METVTILFIGDIMGAPGRAAVAEMLPKLRQSHTIDLVIGNAENVTGGFGVTKEKYQTLLDLGIDVMTTGNHLWDKKEFIKDIASCSRLVKPANYPPGVPGAEVVLAPLPGKPPVAVINLMGRVFMPILDCPFRTADRLASELSRQTPFVFVDIHAEATSEKVAMGWYLDGRVSAVVGSHTHVQTADERILPQGTAYLTDAGLTGPRDSVIGVDKDQIIDRFLTQMPKRFEVPKKGPKQFCAALVTLGLSGKALSIRRIFEEVL